jgi:NAD(P)-dependent dehydrogenase (short-subunit alcohol dehydrogenase family)
MDINGRKVLILGGSGLVGLAVARRLLEHRPASLTIHALRESEVDAGVAELGAAADRAGATLRGTFGDLFVPRALKDRSRDEILRDAAARALLLDDMLGDMGGGVVERSTLGALVIDQRPDIVIDCVNTATAFAYQNVFESARGLRAESGGGGASGESVERHLATLYLPQLIRHVQIALDAMRRVGTGLYLKIGTSGTGGMGLNVPFTHSEERPSRVLLAKAGLAGAHTMYLFLMARTPGAPAVKEIKPTAAISWKRIGFGPVRRSGTPIERFDATVPVPLASAFGDGNASPSWEPAGGPLEGVYLDAGENGLFSAPEFEALTALGLMEYITPEEIAESAVREIMGHPTGRDVVGALDAATSGPTYRAGVLREVALARMAELEEAHGVEPVAYEALGPPRLAKLLFEATLLGRLFQDLAAASELDPEATAQRAWEVVQGDAELRVRMLSVGFPILLPGGSSVLRGPVVVVPPAPGGVQDASAIDAGWIDLRPENWKRWRARFVAMRELPSDDAADVGSAADLDPGDRRGALRPGRLAAWVLRYEEAGERIKR